MCSSGAPLLYDYEYDQWGTLTDHNGVDDQILNETYYYITASGQVLEETSGLYNDNGTYFPLLLTTAWFKPSALQGFGRIWRVFLQGFFPATVPLQVQISYNYNPTVVDTFTITPATNLSQIRIFPTQQHCESIQLTIQDTSPWSATAKWSLNSIDLEMGMKKGGYKGLGNKNTL